MSHVAPADAAHQCAAQAPPCSLVGAAKALSISSRDADPSHLGWFVRPAFDMAHPRARMSSNPQPPVREAAEWQCMRGRDVKRERDARYSTFCRCSRDLEGWSRQLGRCSPEWGAQAVPHNIMPSTLDGSARLGHGAPAVAHVEQGSNPQPPVRAAAEYGSVTCACAAGTSSASATRDAAHSAEALETWKDGLASWDGALPSGEHRPSPTI